MEEREDDDEQQQQKNINPENSKDGRIRFDSDLNEYVMTGDDGVELVWSSLEKAWFPKYQDELISQQQSVYTFNKPTSTTSTPAKQSKPLPKKRYHQQQQQQPALKISESTVYVTNLPLDITTSELETFFSKCGLILPDLDTGKPRIKIYTDPDNDNLPKGDARVTFFKPESVQLAITLLDETEIRPGFQVKVEKAKYDHKESSTAADKPKQQHQRISKEKKKRIENQIRKLEKQLNWEEDDLGKRMEKAKRTCILRQMFNPEEFRVDPSLILDLKEEIREECEKLGQVTAITVFDENPEGIVSIRFLEPICAKACVKMMHGRYFDGRQITAEIYDGVSKYSIRKNYEEEEEEERQRLERYEKWLESHDGAAAGVGETEIDGIEDENHDDINEELPESKKQRIK